MKVKIKPAGGVPKTIVEIAKELKESNRKEAKRYRDDNILFDSVWCVFDIDDHPNIPDAKQMAIANDLELAISNPAFELWLLLHFRTFPGMQHRDQIKKMLKEQIPYYVKHVDFGKDYVGVYATAASRARKIEVEAIDAGEPNRNPTTGFYRLTELIIGEGALA